MLKYFTFAALCCFPLCALGLQCDFHSHAPANSVLDIQLQPRDAPAAFTLSSLTLMAWPHTPAPGAWSGAAVPIQSLPGIEPTAMLLGVKEATASLAVPSLPFATYGELAAGPNLGAYLHAELMQAELQVQADRMAQKELTGWNSLAAIPESPEAGILPVERRHHHRARRITSLTAFSQPVLLPTGKMGMPATLTATPISQAFTRPMPMPPVALNPRLAVTLAQVFADAPNMATAKPHFLQAVATPGTAFVALIDAPIRESSRPRSAVKPVALPTVIDMDQDDDQD